MEKNNTNIVMSIVGVILLIVPIVISLYSTMAASVENESFILNHDAMVRFFPFAFIGAFILYMVSKKADILRKPIRLLTVLIVVSYLIANVIVVYGTYATANLTTSSPEYIAVLVLIAFYTTAIIVQIIFGVQLFFRLQQENR